MAKTLKFKVAPHIVEDLGLNLYTSLPRVLVEFLANAYDADARCARVSYDKLKIEKAREVLKKEFELEKAKADAGANVRPLAARTLPEEVQIVIEDDGIGMTRDELDEKFLFAGRRRRQEEPDSKGRTPKGRPLMGRKGLGKLAGFGVAKTIEVVTRKLGEAHATKVTLSYDELVKKRTANEIEVPDEPLNDGGGIAKSGTRIVLKCLLYDPLKSRTRTIEHEIGDHFALIDRADFGIFLNESPVAPQPVTHAYAWPQPDEVPIDQYVERSLPRETGGEIAFRYRIRFTGKGEALAAERRGVRVYARKRLAAVPSLLGADTNMHGFRMTDYMDGVVHADFVDDEEADYIATDRQSLRWDSPLLSGLHDFLSAEIKEACKQYQAVRDEDARKAVKKDAFTKEEIEKHSFSKKDGRLAYRFAAVLESACKRGVEDPEYKSKLPVLVRSIGHGTILATIHELSKQNRPELNAVAAEIARLTKDELDQFVGTVRGRLDGIQALRKIVKNVDFKARKQEKQVQSLFEKCPWMIDPTYTQFLTADRPIEALFDRLAKELEVANYAPPNAENLDERPDLVYLIGNASLARLVVVELKAANVMLEAKHLEQLEYYMERAESWLKDQGKTLRIHGHLIGSHAPDNARGRGVVVLRRSIKKAGPDTPWRVRDYMEVLEDAEAAHLELLETQRRAEEQEASGEDEE